MASKQSINEILYFGLIDYVPKKKLIDYKNEFSSRKTHNTKFALSFFPKYIDFDKAIKKPKQHYDTLLLNYWIVEVPINGLKWSRLISDYEYGKNSITNKRIRAERNNVKTRTKLLLTKKQKEERRKKKLDLSKEPVLHGEVIRRMKIDPEYAAKIKAIAKKNSEKELSFREKAKALTQNKQARFLTKEQLEQQKESVINAEALMNMSYSSEQVDEQIASSFRIHGQKNPNKKKENKKEILDNYVRHENNSKEIGDIVGSDESHDNLVDEKRGRKINFDRFKLKVASENDIIAKVFNYIIDWIQVFFFIGLILVCVFLFQHLYFFIFSPIIEYLRSVFF